MIGGQIKICNRKVLWVCTKQNITNWKKIIKENSKILHFQHKSVTQLDITCWRKTDNFVKAI